MYGRNYKKKELLFNQSKACVHLLREEIMKKVINDPKEVVNEMLEGIASAYPDLLRIVPENKAILRKDAPVKGKVALISGGGSGHEPAHGGYVGRGMLDAALAGCGLHVSHHGRHRGRHEDDRLRSGRLSGREELLGGRDELRDGGGDARGRRASRWKPLSWTTT